MIQKKNLITFLMILAVVLNLGMSRRGQYDETAREQEQLEKQAAPAVPSPEAHHPVKNFAAGVKEMTVDNAKDALSDTAEGTGEKHPVAGTIDGVKKGGDKVIDNTIKGVKKVASLGFAKDDSYSVEEPEDRSGDAAKIKLFQF